MKNEASRGPDAAAPETARHRSGESITELLRDLVNDLSTLVSQEVMLAKAEFREAASDLQSGVMSLTLGAAVAIAGLVVLLMSAVHGLNNVMEPWLSALIVGGVALLIGYMMVSSARSRMKPSTAVPDRTIEALKKDTRTVKRAAR